MIANDVSVMSTITSSEGRSWNGQGDTCAYCGGRVSADRYRTIRDGGYRHALRLYRDEGTNAMRLVASVLDDDME